MSWALSMSADVTSQLITLPLLIIDIALAVLGYPMRAMKSLARSALAISSEVYFSFLP